MTEHGAAHHDLSWSDALGTLFDPVVNFTIFAVVLYVVLRGPLLEYLRDRAAGLRNALDAGAAARREAEALREALQKDLADLPGLRKQLRTELVDTAERQRAKIEETARQTADRLRRDAEIAGAQEETAARLALRRDLTESAIRRATGIVRDAVGSDDQRRFVSEFLDEAQSL